MWRELELVKCKDVVAVDGRGIGILQEGAQVIACTGKVRWIWWGVEGVFPCAVVVLLDGSTKPLLAVLGKVVMGQEGHCQWDVWFWWREVAVDQGFVEDVEGSAAAGFFQVCGHAPDCIDFEVRVASAS